MRKYLLLLLLSGLSVMAFSQNSFNGIKKTKASFLHGLLELADSTNSVHYLQESKELLEGSQLFQYVKLDSHSLTSNRIIWQLEEKKYIVPWLVGGLIEQKKPWVQLGLSHQNLTGNGDRLSAIFTHYLRPSFEVVYDAPYLYKHRWGLQLVAGKSALREPLNTSLNPALPNLANRLFYDVDRWKSDIVLSYLLSSRHRFLTGVQYLGETYDVIPNEDFSPEGIFPEHYEIDKLSLKAGYQYRHMTYDYHREHGSRLSTEVSHTREISDNNEKPFNKLYIDFRRMQCINKAFQLGIRGTIGWSGTKGNPFAPFVIDDHQNVRGVGDRSRRGHSIMGLNAEVRYELLPVLRNYKLYSQLVAWTDYANLYSQKFENNLKIDDIQQAWTTGIGIRLGTYYFWNACFRLDLAYDVRARKYKGIVFGVGQYF